MVKQRQLSRFVINDGVTSNTRAHVEAGYRTALKNLSTMLGEPYAQGSL